MFFMQQAAVEAVEAVEVTAIEIRCFIEIQTLAIRNFTLACTYETEVFFLNTLHRLLNPHRYTPSEYENTGLNIKPAR